RPRAKPQRPAWRPPQESWVPWRDQHLGRKSAQRVPEPALARLARGRRLRSVPWVPEHRSAACKRHSTRRTQAGRETTSVDGWRANALASQVPMPWLVRLGQGPLESGARVLDRLDELGLPLLLATPYPRDGDTL